MFIKTLFISLFIFFVSCKPFETTSSGGPGGPGAPIKPANCAAITDLNKCATAQPQDNTDCAVNHTGLLCVVLPKTCAEILIKEDCPHLKPVCEWQTGNCVDKLGVPPPPGDAAKKSELIESVVNKPAFDEADLDKFVSLDQTQLNEVLAEITKKDSAYKKDVMTKILTENKLNNFIKGDKLDDAFIAAFKTPDENDYAFSNALLTAALADGSGVLQKVQKDIVKKVFEREENGFISRISKQRKAYKTKLGKNALIVTNKINLTEEEKVKIADKLKKIFAFGEEFITAFYDYIEPQEVKESLNSEKMNGQITKAIINLIVEKDLLKEIVTTREQAFALTETVGNIKGIGWSDILPDGKELDPDLALKIRNEMVTNPDKYNNKITEQVVNSFKILCQGVVGCDPNNFTL